MIKIGNYTYASGNCGPFLVHSDKCYSYAHFFQSILTSQLAINVTSLFFILAQMIFLTTKVGYSNEIGCLSCEVILFVKGEAVSSLLQLTYIIHVFIYGYQVRNDTVMCIPQTSSAKIKLLIMQCYLSSDECFLLKALTFLSDILYQQEVCTILQTTLLW